MLYKHIWEFDHVESKISYENKTKEEKNKK